MRMTVSKAVLAGAAQAAAKIASKGQTPAMASAMISASGDAAQVSATDGDQSIVLSVPVDVEREGRALIGAAALSRIASTLPEGPVVLEASGGAAHISGGRSRFGLPTLDPDGWSLPASPECPTGFRADAGAFAAAVKAVSPMCRSAETTGAIAGIHLAYGGGSLLMEATDGYGLARAEIPACGDGQVDAVVYPWFLANVSAFASGDAAIGFDGRVLQAVSGVTSMSIRAVAARYPDLGRFIPQSPAYELAFSRRDLMASLSRALAAGVQRAHVLVEVSGGTMRISAGDGNASFSDEIACDGEARFSCRADLLRTCASSVDGDDVIAVGESRPFTLLKGESVCAGLMHVKEVS